MTGKQQFTILVIDDEQSVLNSIKRFFKKDNYHVMLADNSEEGLAILAKDRVDLLLLDLKMPEMDGLTVLKKAKDLLPGLKVIIQTGHGGVSEAVEAIRNGASDFLEKGDSPELLRNRVGLVHENWVLSQKEWDGKERRGSGFDYDKLMGESPPILRLKDLIARVADTDTTVLIQGESGTGKELVAQALHHHSRRRNAPFVVVDCASISETVIESELFGHEKGAFTGAETATKGLARTANKGTLFLDEIGELSLSVQAKLLRLIQEQTIRPVGSTKNQQVDIRIIAATHHKLLDEVGEKTFRQDLYYRLSTVTLTVPPLRERGADIDLLSNHILCHHEKEAKNKTSISDQAQLLLNQYEWPGNVRELENILLGALVFANDGIILPEDLQPPIGTHLPVEETTLKTGTLASYELEAIRNALAEAKDNRRKAANILDISEATLYRKIKQYGL